MTPDQVLANIREMNLSYLELAKKLVQADRPGALVRLGITDASASMLAVMTPQQMTKVSSGNTLLCRAHITDDLVWGLLTSHGRRPASNDVLHREHDCSHESASESLAKRLLTRTPQAA